jgi:hypothetical protein
MMGFLNKEDGDKMLLDFLLHISKDNGTKRCTEESIKIMEDFQDSQFLLSIILIKSLKSQNLTPPYVNDFETKIASALATIFTTCEKEDVPVALQELFEGNDDEVFKKVNNSRKINFAIQQFVSAYYQYDFFENKYPEINKML